jgi:hypothetical protein
LSTIIDEEEEEEAVVADAIDLSGAEERRGLQIRSSRYPR